MGNFKMQVAYLVNSRCLATWKLTMLSNLFSKFTMPCHVEINNAKQLI